MADAKTIRTTIDRSIKALQLRPALGKKTAVSKIRIDEGLTCRIEEGRWKLTADLSESAGGSGAGPDPGVLGRAALGSCLAMGYVIWAAVREVPITGVEVEVQADFDVSAQYGLGEEPPGYTEVRCRVSIESPAAEEKVMAIVEEAEANSSYLDVFGRAQKIVRTVDITTPRM